MASFSFAGWIPLLSDQLICTYKNPSGWFFTSVQDDDIPQYIAYKPQFLGNKLCNILFSAVETTQSFHDIIVDDYDNQEGLSESTRDELYNQYKAFEIYPIAEFNVTVNYDIRTGLTVMECQYNSMFENALSQRDLWQQQIYSIVRDFYHTHTHHDQDGDACLQVYSFQGNFDIKKFSDNIWRQYQIKMSSFQKNLAIFSSALHIVENSKRLMTENKVVFTGHCLKYMHNDQGELVYAKSFVRRFFSKNDQNIRKECIENVKESIHIHFRYVSAKYTTLVDRSSLSLASKANKLAMSAVIVALIIGFAQLLSALVRR